GIEVGELRDQARARSARFPHADDAAATDLYSSAPNAIQRFEAIAVFARGDDLAVELGRCIEVVVVVIEPGSLERFGLTVLEHAKRRAGLESQRLDLAHHGEHRLEIAISRTTPRGAHAEARRACSLRG